MKKNKIETIKYVIENIVRNINSSLINNIINDVMANESLTSRLHISQFINKRLNLKSYGITSKKYWLCRGWSEIESEEKRKKVNKKSPMQISFWLNEINPNTNAFYTENEASFKIKSQRKMNIEYWLNKGYNEQDSIIMVSNYQKESTKVKTNKMLQNPDLYDDMLETQLKYWLKKGYNINEAENKLSERQNTISLEKTIKLYGEVKGNILYKERCKALGYRNTLQYHLDKYGELEGTSRYISKNKNSRRFRSSNEAYIFFKPIYKYLRYNNYTIEDIYWGVGKSKEYFLRDLKNKSIYFYDFTIPKLKIIIEYNGIAFHPNPSWNKDKWNAWYSVYLKENADDKYNFDIKKQQVALDNGYHYIQVYNDELQDKQEEIINFLQTKIHE